jgi:hypothetical protein
MTAGEKREEAPEEDAVTILGAIIDAFDDDMEEKMTKAQDFKSSRYRPLHSRYD